MELVAVRAGRDFHAEIFRGDKGAAAGFDIGNQKILSSLDFTGDLKLRQRRDLFHVRRDYAHSSFLSNLFHNLFLQIFSASAKVAA